MAFNIHDKAIVKPFKEKATIVDTLISATSGEVRYKVCFDRSDYIPSQLFEEADLEPVEEKPEYSFTFDIADDERNIVIAIIRKTVGDVTTEIGRGHGHIIHDGDDGIVQAASWALKKIWQDMNGGRVGRW